MTYTFTFTLTWISLVLVGLAKAQTGTNGFCNLVWNDEFTGTTVDTSKWRIEQNCHGGGNNELQCYTARPKNIFVENGDLVLKAYKENYTGTQAGCTDTQDCTLTKGFTSGRVNSAISPAGSFTYGRFEMRAKLCSGSHLWPAYWMLPTDFSYGGWAASGEIDIMEQRGNKPALVGGTLHHGGAWPNNIWTTSGDFHLSANDDLSLAYHIYAVEWTATSMKWYIDDYNFQTFDTIRWWNSTVNNNPYSAKGQPWNKRFNIILNLAIGGGFFNSYPALTDADVAAWKTQEYRIDYIRAYAYTGGACSPTSPASTTAVPTSTTASPSSSSTAYTSTTATPTPTLPTTKMTVSNSGENSGEDLEGSPSLPGNTVIAIAAGVGGFAFLVGVAGIVVGAMLILKSRRNLMMPPLTPSGSQEHLKPYPGY